MADAAGRRIVLDALAELARAVGRRAVDAAVYLFEPDAMLIGTGGHSVGHDAIRSYVRAVMQQPAILSWEWDERSLVTRAEGDLVWFLVTGTAVLTPDAAPAVQTRTAMRLSGVLRQQAEGGWRWAQFHGSTPDAD
jgi:uncharacterized protein (TIGR02246 family)